jgi:hypothetical protein
MNGLLPSFFESPGSGCAIKSLPLKDSGHFRTLARDPTFNSPQESLISRVFRFPLGIGAKLDSDYNIAPLARKPEAAYRKLS